MRIYIPTLGRADHQITWNELPAQFKDQNAVLVVDPKEEHLHHNYPFIVAPKWASSIGKVRQFICDVHDRRKYGDCLLMMDDDLRFYARRKDDPTKFLDSSTADLLKFMKTLEHLMYDLDFAHAGMLAREGANRNVEPFMFNTRLLRVLAYNVRIMQKKNVKFDRLIVMEDFDVALQLLRKGFASVALCNWVHNQVGSGTSGGCSTYRTLARQAEGAHGLEELHHPFVKTVQKTTKTAWQGATRTDVVVSWKAAYQSSGKEEPCLNRTRRSA